MKMSFSALLCASLLASPVWGDEVLEQIEQARQYYADGDYAGAITELQFAVNEIRSKANAQYADTFPVAPAGWTSTAAETEEGAAFFGGGSALSRTYSEDGGSGSINAQLLVDNPMVQGFAAMLSSPMLMAAQPNMKRVRVERENAVLQWEEQTKSGEISLVLGGRILVKLEGKSLSGPDVLTNLMKGWDIKKLKKIAGI